MTEMTLKPTVRRVLSAKRRVGSEASLIGPDESSVSVPIVEEAVHVTKRLVDNGGYRISKQVTEEAVTVDEPLERQTVDVERRHVGRPLEHGELPQSRYEGNTWIVPVIKEVLVTEKRLVLVEEVRVTTSFGTYHEPQRVSLRKEEVSVERIEPGDRSESESS